jgi:hypothetical protein
VQTADIIATASMVASVAAVVVAVYAIFKSNKNSSVATLVALNQGFRQGWDSYLSSKDDNQRFFNLSELLNLLEIACGIQVERSLSGVSRVIIQQYLDEILGLLIADPYMNGQIAKMLNAPTTFCNIKKIIQSKPSYLSVIVPPEWYQTI